MTVNHNHNDGKPLVKVVSFGFKKNDVPAANLMLDVRFLKNPYWVEELRPLTGRDERVKDYVMDQRLAQDFLGNLLRLIEQFVPALLEAKTHSVTIAIGCTGGQHRSVAVAEELSRLMTEDYPQYHVTVWHRELDIDLDMDSNSDSECEPAAAGTGDQQKVLGMVEGGHQ